MDLYEMFLQAAGEQRSGLGDVRYALEEVIKELGLMAAALPAAEAVKTAGNKAETQTEGTLLKALKSGFGVAPLVGGLIELFGRGSSNKEPEPFVKYAMPAPLKFEAGERGGRISMVDYDQFGMARAFPPAAAGSVGSGAQITVNVQTLDARSFMDRSGDIALAVRDAMLNSNSINDVVNDL